MATHSSILAWKFQGQRSLMGDSPWVLRVRHDRVTNTILLYAQVGTWTHTRCVYSLSYVFTVKEVLTLAMCFSLLQIEWIEQGTSQTQIPALVELTP